MQKLLEKNLEKILLLAPAFYIIQKLADMAKMWKVAELSGNFH
jgi:hypothetical protein